MTSIKRGTTPTIVVQIDGITPEDIQKIEFIFKHNAKESAKEICYKVYPGNDVTFDQQSGCFHISVTEDETRAFLAGATGYMDTRITLLNGSIPATDIARFVVMETLFKAVES